MLYSCWPYSVPKLILFFCSYLNLSDCTYFFLGGGGDLSPIVKEFCLKNMSIAQRAEKSGATR